MFDNDHRGAWSALVPFAGGHTILNCISEEIGVLPGALSGIAKVFPKVFPKVFREVIPQVLPEVLPKSGARKCPQK